MSKAQDIQSWLNGDRLRSKGLMRHYPLILLITVLVFLYILIGYQAVRQQHRLTDAKKEMMDAKFQYMTLHEKVTLETKLTSIIQKLRSKDIKSTLQENTRPTIKILN